MQHTKVSYELIQNYISSPRVTEKDSHDPASAIENRLMREIVRENLTKRQKCYIIMYYTKGMTMQEIADGKLGFQERQGGDGLAQRTAPRGDDHRHGDPFAA